MTSEVFVYLTLPGQTSSVTAGRFALDTDRQGNSLQGECRRFDPVSTHQSNHSLTRLFLHAVSRSTVIAGLLRDFFT